MNKLEMVLHHLATYHPAQPKMTSIENLVQKSPARRHPSINSGIRSIRHISHLFSFFSLVKLSGNKAFGYKANRVITQNVLRPSMIFYLAIVHFRAIKVFFFFDGYKTGYFLEREHRVTLHSSAFQGSK